MCMSLLQPYWVYFSMSMSLLQQGCGSVAWCISKHAWLCHGGNRIAHLLHTWLWYKELHTFGCSIRGAEITLGNAGSATPTSITPVPLLESLGWLPMVLWGIMGYQRRNPGFQLALQLTEFSLWCVYILSLISVRKVRLYCQGAEAQRISLLSLNWCLKVNIIVVIITISDRHFCRGRSLTSKSEYQHMKREHLGYFAWKENYK